MRASSRKTAMPRIRALDGGARRARVGDAKAGGARQGTTPAPGHVPGQVFRQFIATLERLDKARRRDNGASGSAGAEG